MAKVLEDRPVGLSELGGSDPFVVLADAGLEAAAVWAVWSRFQNTGQSCIAAKRIIVEDAAADTFTQRPLAHVAQLRIGDPTEAGVTVGPLARADLRDALARQVRESVEQGARVLAGASAPERPGFYYEPTVLDCVSPGMPVLTEEVFGPAVPIVRAVDAAAASALTNDPLRVGEQRLDIGPATRSEARAATLVTLQSTG